MSLHEKYSKLVEIMSSVDTLEHLMLTNCQFVQPYDDRYLSVIDDVQCLHIHQEMTKYSIDLKY